jgi:hypothetical protein
MCTVICIFLIFSLLLKPQGVVIVSMFTSSAVYHVFNPRSGRSTDYNICIWFFYAQHIALSSKSYGWLSQTQYNVDEQSDTFTHGLLFQCVNQ